MPDPVKGYVLAIDGGQSGTSCLLGLKDGTLLASGLGGASAVPNAKITEMMMRSALTACVSEALAAVSPRIQSVEAAYLSLTGGTQAALDFLPTLIRTSRILAESDSVAALACGTFGKPGLALISGTGCVTFSQNLQGQQVSCGGWGYLLGDEGSGFWIGMQAVKATLRAQEGRGPASRLTNQVPARLGVLEMREAQAKIYNEQLSRPEIARLTPLVMDLAEDGDELARAIVTQAADELFLLVRAASLQAGFTQDDEKIIVATGGVMRPRGPVFIEFLQRVAENLPDYRVVSPRFPPVIGAYILGLQLAGALIDEKTIQRIEVSAAAIPSKHLKA